MPCEVVKDLWLFSRDWSPFVPGKKSPELIFKFRFFILIQNSFNN